MKNLLRVTPTSLSFVHRGFSFFRPIERRENSESPGERQHELPKKSRAFVSFTIAAPFHSNSGKSCASGLPILRE